MIRTKSEAEIFDFYVKKKLKIIYDNDGVDYNVGKVLNLAYVKPISDEKIEIPSALHIISKQFLFLFNGYAQAINKAFNRTGGLFEEPFRRILVDSDAYFTELIYYIHHNSQKHGFVKDFRTYPHSSYHSHLSKAMTRLRREEVWAWFGNRDEFEKFHIGNPGLDNLDKFMIEFD